MAGVVGTKQNGEGKGGASTVTREGLTEEVT